MELDYQLALLMQHKFENENRSQRNGEKSDEALAKILQEQFEHEVNFEVSSDLICDKPNSTSSNNKCLTDSTWELADPTPDIHALFVAFDKRFFWSKLGVVNVCWSKRMTSCAGVCSYHPRGGMCSISLSEPLLKLRPRKDLVETLLHEMIHAFLFVTHNNRDRDGHGPEFHKHMYRINKEAGTNITVYHSFHDEVRLYKRHVWRCNGPCQNRKPFFGMLYRAVNRAPGPHDRWWGEHYRTCGGTYVKVSAPEDPKKKSKEVKKQGKPTHTPTITSPKSTAVGNAKTLKDYWKSTSGSGGNKTSTSKVTINGISGGKLNTTNISTPTFNNSGSTSSTNSPTSDFVSVRNHWQNKFNSTSNTAKRPAPPSCNSTKLLKTSTGSATPLVAPENNVPCPVCGQIVLMTALNQHLDSCLGVSEAFVDLTDTEEEDLKECPLCSNRVSPSSFDTHVEQCLLKVYDEVEDKYGSGANGSRIEVNSDNTSCLACGKNIPKVSLNAHLEECMLDIFADSEDNFKESKDGEPKYNCPFCMKLFKETEMKVHIDSCLSTMHQSETDKLDFVNSL